MFGSVNRLIPAIQVHPQPANRHWSEAGQAIVVLRLVHDIIEECKGYYYARVAAAADRALHISHPPLRDCRRIDAWMKKNF